MRFVIGFLMVIYCLGCGGGAGDTPELGTVHGLVKMDGQPLPDATVRFMPVEAGRFSTGRTDENGEYELQYSQSAEGAVLGKHKVTIRTYSSDDDNVVPEKVPIQYNNETTLEAEVKPGSNELNFEDLKSDGQVIQPDDAEKNETRRRSDGCS
jgi:hypothetical protein